LHADGGNLMLQVTASGVRTWIFRYRLHGRRRDMGLGPLHTVTLAEARKRARDARELVSQGVSPIEHRLDARAAAGERALMTFDECAKRYIAAKQPEWKNAKHAGQWVATLRDYCGPVFGSKPVAAVTTELVLRVLSPMWTTKTETASRLRGRIESVLSWATTHGYRKGENPARWRGHLNNLLAKPAKVRRVKHHPALPWQELGAFMATLRGADGVGARALELTILTAARSGGVRGMRWDEVQGDVWIIPAERMKAGIEHRVPLSKAAQRLLGAIPQVSTLVFPGTVRDGAGGFKPLSDMSLSAVLRRLGRENITVHGFRSTFRDWAGESGFPREVAEQALAHTIENKSEAAYSRSGLLERRRPMMETWADVCARDATKERHASVVPLSRAK
jgi:integrase